MFWEFGFECLSQIIGLRLSETYAGNDDFSACKGGVIG